MDRNGKTSPPLWLILIMVLVIRYLCHGIALLLILPHEMQPGGVLPDLLLRHTPYVEWLAPMKWRVWRRIWKGGRASRQSLGPGRKKLETLLELL